MELRSCISFRIFPSVLIEEKPRQLLCIVTSAWSDPSFGYPKAANRDGIFIVEVKGGNFFKTFPGV